MWSINLAFQRNTEYIMHTESSLHLSKLFLLLLQSRLFWLLPTCILMKWSHLASGKCLLNWKHFEPIWNFVFPFFCVCVYSCTSCPIQAFLLSLYCTRPWNMIHIIFILTKLFMHLRTHLYLLFRFHLFTIWNFFSISFDKICSITYFLVAKCRQCLRWHRFTDNIIDKGFRVRLPFQPISGPTLQVTCWSEKVACSYLRDVTGFNGGCMIWHTVILFDTLGGLILGLVQQFARFPYVAYCSFKYCLHQLNPVPSAPASPQPAKQLSHQCRFRVLLRPPPVNPYCPHLSAVDSIETYSCECGRLCIASLPNAASSASSPRLPPSCHYSHFHPSLRAINNATLSSSSSVCTHTHTHKG